MKRVRVKKVECENGQDERKGDGEAFAAVLMFKWATRCFVLFDINAASWPLRPHGLCYDNGDYGCG